MLPPVQSVYQVPFKINIRKILALIAVQEITLMKVPVAVSNVRREHIQGESDQHCVQIAQLDNSMITSGKVLAKYGRNKLFLCV